MSTRLPALGFIETEYLSITAMVADALAKAARVRVLGLEPAGTELIMIRIAGESPADIEAALDAARDEASRLGGTATTTMLARPDERIPSLNEGPLVINGLYGGREEFKPTDHTPNRLKTMSNKKNAIGILETQGLTASLEATDAMLKAADVRLVGKEKIGAAYVTIIIEGDVAAVKAAVETGAAAVGSLGKLIAAHVIARPHDDMLALLPG